MPVCSFWIFFQESFLEKGLHISMNGRFIFSGGFIFKLIGHPNGVASAFMGRGALVMGTRSPRKKFIFTFREYFKHS